MGYLICYQHPAPDDELSVWVSRDDHLGDTPFSLLEDYLCKGITVEILEYHPGDIFYGDVAALLNWRVTLGVDHELTGVKDDDDRSD